MTSLAASNPSLIDKLAGWLEHPFGKFITGVVCPAVVAIGTSIGYQAYNRFLDQKTKIADTFIENSLLYERESLNMLEPLLVGSGPITTKSREDLIENLRDQSQALYAASNLLKPSKLQLAERYQNELLAVRAMINKLKPDEVSEFYDASKPLLEDRDRLIFALEPSRFSNAANTPATSATPDVPAPPR